MRAARAIFVTVPLLLAGCVDAFGDKDPHQPGDQLGTFHITAKEQHNSCGSGALGAPAVWELDVKLAWGDGTIFWNSGGEVISGVLSDDRTQFDIQTDVVIDMRTDADKGKPPCSMARHDTAKGTLALAGDAVSEAKGALSYDFAPTEGSKCGDLVTSDPALFEVLPCSIEYAFTAPHTGP